MGLRLSLQLSKVMLQVVVQEIGKKIEKEQKLQDGNQYSIKTKDGRYISVNRLDPIMMPFMIAADFVDAFNDFFLNTMKIYLKKLKINILSLVWV